MHFATKKKHPVSSRSYKNVEPFGNLGVKHNKLSDPNPNNPAF